MSTSVHIVKHLLYGTIIVLLGAVSAFGLTMVAVQIVDDAADLPRSWALMMAVAMGLVALSVSMRARAARELQRQVDRMQWTHTERAIAGVAEANRRHAERLHAMMQARLYELGLQFSAAERGQLAESVEQLHAVRTILVDWRERAERNGTAELGVEDVAEPLALLDLAAATMADVALGSPLPPSPTPRPCTRDIHG